MTLNLLKSNLLLQGFHESISSSRFSLKHIKVYFLSNIGIVDVYNGQKTIALSATPKEAWTKIFGLLTHEL